MSGIAAPRLRLRQVCLVAPALAEPAADLEAIFGLAECHRDSNVARYGLENVLFPIGTDFLEIVAPLREGTAAGRFLTRHAGRHGYMIIMDCEDPRRREAHCAALGVRTAHRIEREDYLGVQLHPADTGAAMLEFNRTTGGGDPRGPYAPAGPHWQKAIRSDVTRSLLAAQIECRDPAAFAARWGEILQRPVSRVPGGPACIALDAGAIEFVQASSGDAALTGLRLEVADPERVLRSAKARGRLDAQGRIDVCGVRFCLNRATRPSSSCPSCPRR